MSVATIIGHPRVNLVKHLVGRDLKARYKVSVLGFFWSLLRPLFMIAIFTILVERFFRFHMSYENLHYWVFLICGFLPWGFFGESIVESTSCFIANANLIRKVYLPRVVFPLSAVLAKLINFLLALLVLLPVVFIFGGVRPGWPLLLFPVVLFAQFILVFGLGLFLSVGNVFFRDLSIVVDVLIMGWFYMTPVFYPLHIVWHRLGSRPGLRFLYMSNPMASIIYAYRRVLLYSMTESSDFPLPISDAQAVGYFLFGLTVSIVLLILGALVFRRYQHFVEDYL